MKLQKQPTSLANYRKPAQTEQETKVGNASNPSFSAIVSPQKKSASAAQSPKFLAQRHLNRNPSIKKGEMPSSRLEVHSDLSPPSGLLPEGPDAQLLEIETSPNARLPTEWYSPSSESAGELSESEKSVEPEKLPTPRDEANQRSDPSSPPRHFVQKSPSTRDHRLDIATARYPDVLKRNKDVKNLKAQKTRSAYQSAKSPGVADFKSPRKVPQELSKKKLDEVAPKLLAINHPISTRNQAIKDFETLDLRFVENQSQTVFSHEYEGVKQRGAREILTAIDEEIYATIAGKQTELQQNASSFFEVHPDIADPLNSSKFFSKISEHGSDIKGRMELLVRKLLQGERGDLEKNAKRLADEIKFDLGWLKAAAEILKNKEFISKYDGFYGFVKLGKHLGELHELLDRPESVYSSLIRLTELARNSPVEFGTFLNDYKHSNA